MKITDALVVEHAVFLGVFEELECALPKLNTTLEVRAVARLVEGMLQRHGARESKLAYLALDHILEEKGQLDHMHQDHLEIDECLRQARTTETCLEARRLLAEALAASREHFAFEEKSLFPLLEQVLAPDTLCELGRAWTQSHRETLCRD